MVVFVNFLLFINAVGAYYLHLNFHFSFNLTDNQRYFRQPKSLEMRNVLQFTRCHTYKTSIQVCLCSSLSTREKGLLHNLFRCFVQLIRNKEIDRAHFSLTSISVTCTILKHITITVHCSLHKL